MVIAVFVGLTLISVWAAHVLAPRWGRSRSSWVWASLLMGPLAIGLLVLMPRKSVETA